MKNNWKPLLIILAVLLLSIFGIKMFLASLAPVFGGPAKPQIRKDVTTMMKSIFNDHHLNGQLVIKEVNHVGFDPGGITVSYSYSEDVNGKPVTLTEQMDGLDDQGKLVNDYSDLDDFGDGFVDFIKLASLQQPYYQKTSKEIFSELKKQETSHFKLDGKSENSVQPGLPTFVEDDSTLPSCLWFKQQVNDNQTSNDPNRRAFNGYYSISPQQALAKGTAYYRINFIYHVSSGKEYTQVSSEGRKTLDQLISKLDFKKFPDGKYSFGFDVNDGESTMGDIRNSKYIQVGNGKVIAQSSYGEDTMIEYWPE